MQAVVTHGCTPSICQPRGSNAAPVQAFLSFPLGASRAPSPTVFRRLTAGSGTPPCDFLEERPLLRKRSPDLPAARAPCGLATHIRTGRCRHPADRLSEPLVAAHAKSDP